MLVSEFDFHLPEELIAQEAAPRGASRLMVLNRRTEAIQHTTISALPSLLNAGDVLVVNNTRVFAARLLGHRVPSGGAVECLLLARAPRSPQARKPGSPVAREPGNPGAGEPGSPVAREAGGPVAREPGSPGAREAESLVATEPGERWTALVHPGQKLKPGALVRFEGEAGVLMAEVLERHFHGRRTIRLWAESGGDIATLVDELGHIPLPPYIKRPDTPADRERYQTIFARRRGSVAAPTAGLHFTPALMSELAQRGVHQAEVTLHVGYGTFKPVRTDVVETHVVDPEEYEIGAEAAAAINRASIEGRRIVAVGTTTTRGLEDAAQRGEGRVAPGRAVASLFIYPGFRFQIVGALLTNFHLPRSSLLMLVCAFAGRERLLAAYREAIAHRYRFYSYGDAMLIL